MTVAPTAPTLSPDEIPAMLQSPQFAELPPERRTDILERALADGASSLAGQWDRDTFQKWGEFAGKARERVAGMETLGEEVAWAGGVLKDTAADMLKTLGVGVAGLSPVAAPRDAQGGSTLVPQVPGLTLGQSLGVNAAALATGITDKLTKDAAPVESGLEALKQEIDQGAFFDHKKGFGGWLDDKAKALQEAQTAYYQDENWAQQNSLTANPDNAAALQDYLLTRSPQAWDRLRSTVLRTPGGESVRAARDQVTKESALGRSLPGAQQYITEATDPAELLATVGSLGAGKVAIQGGRTLLQRGGALAAGAAGEVAGEQVSAFMDDPNLTWEQRGEIAKQALVASLGLAGIGAGVSAVAGRGRTTNVPAPAAAEAGQNPFAGPIAEPAMAEDTGDLTAADVADLEPQPTPPPAAAPPRQPILTGVPDRMGRMRETSLNEEPVMEGDVITDLRIPRSPEALAESQRIENDRLVQEAKLRAQDAKARGMPMIADSPNGSRDILDWANENPIYLPPGFSADRKLPEYEALGRNPLPSYWRQFVASGKQGGNPDTIAQRAYDAGLIAEPTADAYVNALQEGIAGRQQYRVQFAARDKALVQEEKRVVDFEKAQGKLAKKPAAQEVTFEDVLPGDRMTIDGEPAVVRNVEYNEDGYLTNVVIEDGQRFGLMQFDPQTRGGLLVDEFKPKSSTPAPAPSQAATAPASPTASGTAENRTSGGGTATSAAASAPAAPAASGNLNPQAGRPRAGEAGFVNAEILSDLAASAMQAGQDFATWARQMLARFGEAVRAQLAAIWQQAQAQFQAREVRFGGRVTRMAPAATRGFVAVPDGAESGPNGGQMGPNETQARFASPDAEANVISTRPDTEVLAEAQAWLSQRTPQDALTSLENGSAALAGDAKQRALGLLINQLSLQAMQGSEVQQIVNDTLLNRAGRLWHSEQFSADVARELRQRNVVNNADLLPVAPVLAAKQVLTDRADRVVKERFEGGAEGAVEKIITLDVKAGTEASAELTAQLEGEPDAPELGDNPEVTPVNDTRVAEMEQQMQELRQQMLRDQTQAENALQETTSTWQKIMGVLKAAGGRRSSLLTGAKGKLADLRKAAMARKAARRAEGRMYANPVGDFADDAIIGASFLAEGLVEFTNWSQALIREIGFRSGQDLRKLYAEASKQYLAALEAEKAAPTRTKGTPKQRQAREKINKAQRTAQNILDSIARRYSDPPIFEEGQRRINAMRELYKERVRTGMPEAEFVKRAMALGANEGTAGILWEASKLEIDAREMMALEKSRAGLAEFLKKDSPALAKMLNALRQKIAPGMSWAQIFMELPAQQKARQREIYRRLMLDERLKALNQAERLQLTNELDKAWQRERRKVFLRELEKVGALGAKAPADRKKVVQGLPKLLRLMNLGVLNAATFRQAMAPEFNLRSMTGADVARLRDTFNAAYTAPPGILRNRLLQKGLMDMQKITGSTKVELLNNGWVASVLSGGQTFFDTATTLATGGLLDTMTSAVGMAFNGRPDVAITAVAEFWRSLPQLLREAGRILGKGELWYLRQFADEAKHGLEGLGIGSALTGERLLSEKQIRKKALGLLLAFTGRSMAAFDHLTNNATKAGALPIARALNPNLYQGALTPSDLDKANARAQAKLEMPDGTPTQINRRTREILESGINPDLLKEAELMGDMAAFQNDPTGFYGGVYQMVKSLFATGERGLTNAADAVPNAYARSAMLFMAGSLRAALGAKFIRFAMNWANKQAMLVPGTYLIQKAGLPIFGSQISRTQANYILGRNVVGLTMMASFYAFLRGVLDKDDEEEGWHLTGNLEGLSTDRINALRAAGVEKLTLWYRDSQGRVVRQVNYKNMPFAAMLAALASTSDERKYLPDKHATRTQAGHLLRAVAIGAMQFKDISAVEGLSELFQKPKPGSTSEVAEDFVERLAKSAARFTTGFIPNALRDVDSWTDSRYFKPDSAAAEWVKGVPFLRRTVNDGRPLLNLLGEQVEISRAPWNRQVKDVATSEAGRVLGGLLSRGLSVPGADGDGVVVVKDGKKVLLTSLGTGPVYAYQKAVTERYREWLGSDEGRALLSMPAAQAAQVIENRAKAIKRMARVQAVGY